MLNMIKADRAVRSGRRAEVFEICLVVLVELRAEPRIKTADVRHILHDLHADGAAEKLRFGLLRRFDLNDPGGLAALVRQQAEVRHIADHRSHHVDDAGVAVAARAEHAVGVNNGGGLRPGEDLALFGNVADFVKVAGAGEVLFVLHAHAAELLFVARLELIHELLEHKILQHVRGDVRIERKRVRGELLLEFRAGGKKLVVKIVHRLHRVDAEADDRVAVLARDRHELFRAECIAVHDKRFHHLGKHFALFTVQDCLLFRGQIHMLTLLNMCFSQHIAIITPFIRKSIPPRHFVREERQAARKRAKYRAPAQC